MPDAADYASAIQQTSLQRSLKNHALRDQGEQRRANGVVVRRDCDEPVQVERLRANPSAVRCIDCQAEHEHEERMIWKK